MTAARSIAIWTVVVLAIVIPVTAAATSPLLEWRRPVYIAAGLAGVVALCLTFVQPLLASGFLPGLPAGPGRRLHRGVGALLVLAVVFHVAGLWITSPPDVIDALTFTSPTPFSAWGVIAMWAVFSAALLAASRRRLRLRPRIWRLAHTSLASVIVVGGVIHALLIEGTMEPVSKTVLCVLVLAATIKAVTDLGAGSVKRPAQREREAPACSRRSPTR